MECKIVSPGVQIEREEEEEEEEVTEMKRLFMKMKVIDQVEIHSLT